MAQNENISLSLANKIDILNKSQSVDARYGVYETEEDALDAMALYGLDGRQVAVYTDKPNGKVRLYLYNEVLHQLEPISGGDIEAIDVSYDDTTTQLGVDNTQLAIEKVYKKAIVKDYINIIDFGAVGDGVTESAQFIQDALDFAETNGIRRVYAPTGDYLLEKTVYIPTEIEFYGDGMDKTIFKIDEETILDTIGMFDGATHYQNFYTPVISTKTTRTGDEVNNILLKDFSIDDIYYDDTGLNSQVCPMLILNSKNSKIENVEFGNIQSEREQDGVTQRCLGLSIAFSENILIDKCVHGFAGYEVVSIRYLSRYITTRQNVFNIDKPLNLKAADHSLQVARPTSMISFLQSEYGEERCTHYTSQGDIFNMVSGVQHAITVHSTDYVTITQSTVNSLGNTTNANRVFKLFDNSNYITVTDNLINFVETQDVVEENIYAFCMIGINQSKLNPDPLTESSYFTVSNNIINLTLAKDLSSLAERDITAIIGNTRTKFHNTTITDNVVNITGTGIRDQAVFGAYGSNIIMSGNVVNFDGEASENMRAFVVEGGDRINVINNSTTGIHAYSLKVNNVESLENLIIGANNFSSITLNNQEPKTEVIAYKSDLTAENTFFNGTTSALEADNVQDAIDEVVTMISEAGGGGTIYIELTKTQLDTVIANSELVPGALYKITEVETWMKQGETTKAIYLHAISTNELEKKGMGEFYVPKYNQEVEGYGIWSGELWQKTNGDMGTEPSYNADDVVIWGGKYWKNITGDYGTFINHYELDGTNWEEIPVNDTDYNVRTNIIEYDYANDMITYRKDDVGNEISTSYENWNHIEDKWFKGDPLTISNYNPIKVFQWGNEFNFDSLRVDKGVGFNIVENGVFECINQRGNIYGNTLNNAGIYGNTLENNGGIHDNTLENNGGIHDNNINNGGIHDNTINSGRIYGNNLNNGRIHDNTLNNGRIYYNTLGDNGRIHFNTLENNGQIRLGLSNLIDNKQIQYLTVNTGDIGGISGIDLSSATLVYQDYERIVFKDSTGTTKIRYYDGSGNLVVSDLTD